MGDPANAVLWVRAAADASDSSQADERAAVAHVLDHAPELAALSTDAGFRAARLMLG